MTPGQPPDWQERMKTFGGVKGLPMGDLRIHFKVHPLGASQGRRMWEMELPPR